MSIRALVCGGRDADPYEVWNWLERFGHQDAAQALGRSTQDRIGCVIHGGAGGADKGAGDWGRSEGIPVLRFPANWRKHGRAAGPIRNRQMIDQGRPDVVIAFPGGAGTRDMVRQARAVGLPVVEVGSPAPIPSPDPRALASACPETETEE